MQVIKMDIIFKKVIILNMSTTSTITYASGSRSIDDSNTTVHGKEYSFPSDSVIDVLNSLKFEINLNDEERTACLESYQNYNLLYEDINVASSSESESEYWGTEESEDATEGRSNDWCCRILAEESPITDYSNSCWNKFSLESGFWEGDDLANKRPISYNDLKLTKREEAGILSQRIVSTGLSHLAQLPSQPRFVFTKLQLPNKGLLNISILEKYRNLMYVDLSNNRIEEMGIFSKMNYLIFLNLSNNCIKELNIAEAKPLYLTDLDVSNNRIEELPNFDSLWSLTCLDLAHNNIKEIEGLWSLQYLKCLNLSYNKIELFDVRLFSMNFRELDLSHNNISDWRGHVDYIIVAQSLIQLNLSCNFLKSLEPLKIAYWLEKLDLSCNAITDIDEYKWLKNMRKLDSLSIDNNPVWSNTESRGLLIHLIPSLSFINTLEVTLLEHLNAADLFSNTLVHKAFQMYSWLIMKRHTVEPPGRRIDATRKFQSGTKIILLVGPPGSNKWEIIRQLCDLHPNKVKMGKLVTTREFCGSHMEHVSIKCFNSLIDLGKVVTYEFRLGAGFALCWDALERDSMNQVVIVGVELSSAMCFIWQGLCPTLVLTLIKDKDLHFDNLKKLCQDDNNLECESERFHSDCFLTSPFLTRKPNNLIFEEDEEMLEEDTLPYQLDKICFIQPDDASSSKDFNKCNMMGNFIENWSKSRINSDNSSQPKTSPSSSSENYMNNGSVNESSLPQAGDLSICITEEEVVEEEEIDEIYMKYKLFIDNIINSREEYLDLHHKMPGLFQYSVVTDNVNQAVKKLADVLNIVHYEGCKTIKNPNTYEPKLDPLYSEIVTKNLNGLLQSLTHGQGNVTGRPLVTPKPEPMPNKTSFYFNR